MENVFAVLREVLVAGEFVFTVGFTLDVLIQTAATISRLHCCWGCDLKERFIVLDRIVFVFNSWAIS